MVKIKAESTWIRTPDYDFLIHVFEGYKELDITCWGTKDMPIIITVPKKKNVTINEM